MAEKSNTQKDEVSENGFVPHFEEEEVHDQEFSHLDLDLQKLIVRAREQDGAESFNTTIYRMPTDKRKRAVNLGVVSGDIPSENEVGEEYGRGLYKIWMNFYSKSKKRNSSLTTYYNLDDPIWDERKRKADKSRGEPGVSSDLGVTTPQVSPHQQFTQVLDSVVGVVEKVVTPIIEKVTANKPADPFEMYKGVGKMLQANLENQVMQNFEFQRKMMPQISSSTKVKEESEGDDDLVKDVISLVVEKAGEFLEANALKTKLAKRELMKTEEFHTIVSNPDMFRETVAGIAEQIGGEKTAMVLQKLGLELPQQ